MSAETKVICDACGRDLTYTGNCEDYYLQLASREKLPWYLREGLSGGAVTAMLIPPPIDKPMHFCDLPCMVDWAEQCRAWSIGLNSAVHGRLG